MKSKIISRTNQYLLEHFPGIWNSKLVWMLLSALVVHLLFFLAGYLYFQNPITFQRSWYDSDAIFRSGAALFSVAVSILFVVVWLIQLFKNNAFANYYPVGVKKLWLSFWYYFLIFLGCFSFYVSFQLGYKTFINSEYSVSRTDKELFQAKKASVFLLNNWRDYTLENVRYPSPLDTLERRSNSDFNNCYEGPKVYAQGTWHQFYTTKIVRVSKTDSNFQALSDKSLDQYNVDQEGNEFRLKLVDKVIDVSALVDTNLTLFNYSKNFFTDESSFYSYENVNAADAEKARLKAQFEFSAIVYKMLKNKNDVEIKKTLSDFLALCKTYKVTTNLTSERWFKIVNHPPYYRVDELIRSTPKDRYEVGYDEPVTANVAVATAEAAADDAAVNSAGFDPNLKILDDYVDAPTLKTSLDSILELRPFEKMEFALYFALWMAFGLATLLFAFRITGLKPLLFSAVSAGLIGIVIGFVALLGAYGGGASGISYLVLIIYLAILILSLSGNSVFSKGKSAVLINLSIVAFVPILTLLLVTINSEQRRFFNRAYGYNYKETEHLSILDYLGSNGIHVFLFAAALLFLFFYSRKIRSWKASPEG